MENSNRIEGLWFEIKYIIKHIYHCLPGASAHLKAYIYEALWRRMLNKYKTEDKLNQIILWQ